MKKFEKKKGYVVFKLDLEKAFDNVTWEFLQNCLHDFGFPDITIKLIMHCVSSSTYSMLRNGNKLPQFKPTRGLRQGDPLSPYLFILCMKKLSSAINNAMNQRNWEPIRINNTGSQFKFVSKLFEDFSKALGLKVNLSKSRALFSSDIINNTQLSFNPSIVDAYIWPQNKNGV